MKSFLLLVFPLLLLSLPRLIPSFLLLTLLKIFLSLHSTNHELLHRLIQILYLHLSRSASLPKTLMSKMPTLVGSSTQTHSRDTQALKVFSYKISFLFLLPFLSFYFLSFIFSGYPKTPQSLQRRIFSFR